MDRQSILSKDITKKDSFMEKVCSLFPVALKQHGTLERKIKDKTIKPYLHKQTGLIS